MNVWGLVVGGEEVGEVSLGGKKGTGMWGAQRPSSAAAESSVPARICKESWEKKMNQEGQGPGSWWRAEQLGRANWPGGCWEHRRRSRKWTLGQGPRQEWFWTFSLFLTISLWGTQGIWGPG